MNYVGQAVATDIVYGDVFSWPWSSVDSNYKKQIQHVTVSLNLCSYICHKTGRQKLKQRELQLLTDKVHLLIEIGTASVTPKS
jgi:hypothetical protein